MLTIKKVNNYSKAKYPQKTFHKSPDGIALQYNKKFILPIALLGLIDACRPIGVVGPPPARPEMMTENEARIIIETAFKDNNIIFENDVPYTIPGTGTIILDGYNKEKDIGYEYISEPDLFSTPRKVLVEVMTKKENTIKVIHNIPKYGYAEKMLEEKVLRFIKQLKSTGGI